LATDVVGKNQAVSTDVDQPHPNGAVTVAEERKRPTWRRWLVLGVVVAIALLWTFAIWYSVTRESPEDLDDDALVGLARSCETAESRLEALPDLPEEPTAAEVIALMDQEDEAFAAMVDDMGRITTSGDDAQGALDAWVQDWRDVLDARATFAADLEDDGTARFNLPTVTRGSLEPITERMEEYAAGRGLDQCTPLALQAEIVDVPRDYTLVSE
jgi:hypothetical protein